MDGVTHINIFSKSKCELGRMMSNFYPSVVVYNGIEFANIECYWHWLKYDVSYIREYISPSIADKIDAIRCMDGINAKKYSRQLSHLYKHLMVQRSDFHDLIKTMIIQKVYHNRELLIGLSNTKLPFTHYYEYNGIVTHDSGSQFLCDIYDEIRTSLQM